MQAVRISESAIRRSIQDQLGMLKADAEMLGDFPTVIGEIGTPFDMDGKRSYGWTDGGKYKGDYRRQEKALDASLNGGDGVNAINWTMWTYCPTSSHEWGDGWNMEDLSIWSPDDMRDQQEVLIDIRRDGSRAMLLRGHKERAGNGVLRCCISGCILVQFGYSGFYHCSQYHKSFRPDECTMTAIPTSETAAYGLVG